MKTRIIFSVLMLISVFAVAQTTLSSGNGGQYAENDFGKLKYDGYSAGKYVVDFTNKRTGTVDVKINWLGKDTTITGIVANTTVTISLPGAALGNAEIKSKPLQRISGSGDMGWLEIWSPTSLPVHFKSFSVHKKG